MMADKTSVNDPIETVLARTCSSADAIFRRHGLSVHDARRILFEVVEWLESPRGVVPGAGHRMVKSLEAASRRIQNETSPEEPPASEYAPVFADLVTTVRHRRIASELAQERATVLIPQVVAAAGNGSVPLDDAGLEITKELVRGLIDSSREQWKSNAGKGLAVARRALALLTRFPTQGIDSRFLADLESRAHAYAANALRLLGDYRNAEREFEAAEAALARGTQDPRERAEMLMHLSALRRDQRRFSEALRLLQQAAAIYRWTRERHSEALIFVAMANAQAYAGRPELALPLAQRARELLDHHRDPRMSAGLEKNIAHYLLAAGRVQEAQQQVRVARRLVESIGIAADVRGLRWIEGQIALAVGDREEGEQLLREVRNEYVDLGDSPNAALVSLELVAAYLDQGRAADAKRLAAESLPIFQSLEIHRETLAALIALQRATELETATAGVVRELLERLRRGNPAAPPRPEKPS